MSKVDRFTALAGELFEAVLVNYGDNLTPGDGGEVVYQSMFKRETIEHFACLVRKEFGEDALVEHVAELQTKLAEAQALIRMLQGEQALFPEVVRVAHA